MADNSFLDFYLHSSMDRFEGLTKSRYVGGYIYLHSSMDRFEENIVVYHRDKI